jgi:hypothetical protein
MSEFFVYPEDLSDYEEEAEVIKTSPIKLNNTSTNKVDKVINKTYLNNNSTISVNKFFTAEK